MMHLNDLPPDYSVSFGSMQHDDWLQDFLYDYISQDQSKSPLFQAMIWLGTQAGKACKQSHQQVGSDHWTDGG